MANRSLSWDIWSMTGLPCRRNTKGIWQRGFPSNFRSIIFRRTIRRKDRICNGVPIPTIFTATGLIITYIRKPRMISTKSSNMGWNFHDASFFISNYLNLYEHQSTYSPNAPLRFLIYYKSAICRRLSTKKP